MSYIKFFMPFILSLSLLACQSLTPKDAITIQKDWIIHQEQLKKISAFQVNGTLTYKGAKGKNYGNFFIQHKNNNDYQIKLTSVIGTNILFIMVSPTSAEITDRNGHVYRDHNIESLLKKYANLEIPLSSLHDWLLGYSDDSSIERLDDQGRLYSTKINQHKNLWQMVITHYMSVSYHTQNIDLPANIELTDKQTQIKLKINNWKLL